MIVTIISSSSSIISIASIIIYLGHSACRDALRRSLHHKRTDPEQNNKQARTYFT